MEKKKTWKNGYLYFLVSIVLIILIAAELSQVVEYHSSMGTESANITSSDRSAFVIVAKLPGVSANVALYFMPFFFPDANITAKVPQNSSAAFMSMSNFNNSRYDPEVVVHFNSTSSSMNAVQVTLGGNLSFNLTPSNPVQVHFVAAINHAGLSPAIVTTPEYDYVIIAVNSTLMMNYKEVSR